MTSTITSPQPTTHIDLYSATSFSQGHPYQQYAWLRQNAPVYKHPAPDGGFFWAITRHADIRWVEHHPELFSASPTVTILDMPFESGFLAMDAPRHPQYRRLIAPRLIPTRVKEMVPNLRQIASDLIDDIAAAGECDFVDAVASRMAAYTAADLMGMSRADGLRCHELLMNIHSSPDVVGQEAMDSAMLEMANLAMAKFREKRENPGNDVYSLYANMEVDGRPITELEFLGNYVILTDGSLDTSRNLISGGLKLLFDNPDVREELTGDLDALLPGAIEEMLRLLTPVVYIRRIAKEDLEIHGQPIAKGDRVVIYFGSGNRDEDVYDDPEKFDIRRKASEHMAFGGGGPHFCVGSHLGRAEGAVMLREVLTRLPEIEQAGPVTWAATSLTSGLATLPVKFTARP